MPAPKSSLLVLAALLVLSGCTSSPSSARGASASPRPRISIVTSTDVYSDIAAQVAGPDADVTAIIANPDADPHNYAADAQNALAVSKATIIIENGGGYDDFMNQLRAAVAKKSAAVLDVSELSGLDSGAASATFNEHVWYDFPTVAKLVQSLTSRLAVDDPADAAAYAARAKLFLAGLSQLETREAAIKTDHAGEAVAVTEPVPLYLLQACGLVDRTPPAFSQAIEEGSDVSPRVLDDLLALLRQHQVALLAYNEQTTDATTDKVLAAARAASVPIVPVTETLPANEHYLAWMSANLDAVQGALAAAT